MQALYLHLRAMAGSFLNDERVGHTLQPTALVNEAWLRLQSSENLSAADRTTFLAAAATAMQRVLIDHARTRNAQKRGGGQHRLTLSDVEGHVPDEEADVEHLDGALTALAAEYPRQHQVVTLKYFGGLTVNQIAEFIGVSERSIASDWAFARAWLKVRLTENA